MRTKAEVRSVQANRNCPSDTNIKTMEVPQCYAIHDNTFQAIQSLVHIVCLCLLISLLSPANALAETSTGIQKSNIVTLYYFWLGYCQHCKEAKPFVSNLPKTHPWLTLHSYDLAESRDNTLGYSIIQLSDFITANQCKAEQFLPKMNSIKFDTNDRQKEMPTNHVER